MWYRREPVVCIDKWGSRQYLVVLELIEFLHRLQLDAVYAQVLQVIQLFYQALVCACTCIVL